MKNKITQEIIKKKQIEILDYVDSFCRTNNIKYSLACGTLLGAIRHKGYIPWDDDIDIQLLREDYNKFIELWTKNDNHPYELYSLETKDNWVMAYAKISNPKTIVRDVNYAFYGINIDVFPIDRVIDLDDFSKRHKQVMDLYLKQEQCSRKYNQKWKTILNKLRCFPYTTHNIAKKIQRIAVSSNNKNAEYLFEMVAGRLYKKPFPIEAFKDIENVEFEGKEYLALKGWDIYLTTCYNNYMQLPPKEKQISHHEIEAYWK